MITFMVEAAAGGREALAPATDLVDGHRCSRFDGFGVIGEDPQDVTADRLGAGRPEHAPEGRWGRKRPTSRGCGEIEVVREHRVAPLFRPPHDGRLGGARIADR
jgi:hypothetical protein